MRKALVLFFLASWLPVQAASIELHSFPFPEQRSVTVDMMPRTGAPVTAMKAEVLYKKGQARIELAFDQMKPAILFGGDVTCYVLWAVGRDGHAENLGEVLTRKKNDRLTFSTGKKEFGLMVTAEAFHLAGSPSEMVLFNNAPRFEGSVTSSPFRFDGLSSAPAHGMNDISRIRWDSRIPLELLQARKAYELADRHDAATHATRVFTEAGSALKLANEMAVQSPGKRELRDAARRAVALSNEAISLSMHRKEAIELEQRMEARRAEMERLEQRAREAEGAALEAQRAAQQAHREAQEAQREAAEVEREADRIRVEKQRMVAETRALSQEKGVLESVMTEMRQERVALQNEFERERARLKREKSELNNRLQNALSHVAETRNSVNGFVVNLPDILFDVSESTLKPEAELVLAKLAGILLITSDQQAVIEGYTDSTGSPQLNLDLSQQRAESVRTFLHSQGIGEGRLRALGYGMARPVADNSSSEGRSRNRRVEILIQALEQGRANAPRSSDGAAIPASDENR
jgi:outer membrane protein OmpA-like peptidoglycan-associated protein